VASFLLPGHAGRLRQAPSESPQLYAHDRRSRWATFDASLGMPLRIVVGQKNGALAVVVIAR
jgi:hypothetical protein